MTLSDYVKQQVDERIANVAQAVLRAQNDASAVEIHRLRVAIRKLSECLRVFQDLFPKSAANSVRKDLKAAMKLAGEARNHDIARDLMKRAKVPIAPDIESGRDQAVNHLARILRDWTRISAIDTWRERLNG